VTKKTTAGTTTPATTDGGTTTAGTTADAGATTAGEGGQAGETGQGGQVGASGNVRRAGRPGTPEKPGENGKSGKSGKSGRAGKAGRAAGQRGAATPATAALATAGVEFTLHAYAHDPAAPSYGTEAAEALGTDPARVFKTLVAAVDGRLTVAVVPVSGSLDLKALAAAVGGKRAAMADPADAERATGYVRGGISPLGQRKRLPTVVDASADRHPAVCVSAGRRGLEVELAPADLVALTGAVTAPIAAAR
jgi:Cys-tRNA(Pro)/Cys-tRNA(Cys) deacylase